MPCPYQNMNSPQATIEIPVFLLLLVPLGLSLSVHSASLFSYLAAQSFPITLSSSSPIFDGSRVFSGSFSKIA
jgi:hypothetical protein